MPYLLVILSVAATLGIVLISSSKRKGVRAAGVVYISSGVLVGLAALIFGYGPQWVERRLVNDNSSAELMSNMAQIIGSDISKVLWIYAVAYLLIGVLGIVFAKFYNRNVKEDRVEAKVPQATTGGTVADIGSRRVAGQEKPKPKQPPKIQL